MQIKSLDELKDLDVAVYDKRPVKKTCNGNWIFKNSNDFPENVFSNSNNDDETLDIKNWHYYEEETVVAQLTEGMSITTEQINGWWNSWNNISRIEHFDREGHVYINGDCLSYRDFFNEWTAMTDELVLVWVAMEMGK